MSKTPTDAEVEEALERYKTLGYEYNADYECAKEASDTLRAALASLAAKDAEIARLRARLKSNREMYQRGHAAGFRKAAEWVLGLGEEYCDWYAEKIHAEADRLEGGR